MWRGLIATLVSMVISFIIGFIIGFVMSAMGAPTKLIQIVTFLIGFIIGLAISVVPIRMILGKDFGEFRLVLLSKQNAQTGQDGTT